MAEQETPPERSPPIAKRLDRRAFSFGVAFGCLASIGFVLFFGPKSTTSYEDPLTGRHKQESTWLGFTYYSQIQENDVSRWADKNSIPQVYAGKYGWSHASSTRCGWFTGTTIACGGHGVPSRIMRGTIRVDGLTQEQALQQYQAELVTAFKEHGSTIGVQRMWVQKSNPTNSTGKPSSEPEPASGAN